MKTLTQKLEDGDPLTGSELAEVIGVTPRRVNQLVADGIITRTERQPQFEPVASIGSYIAYLRAGYAKGEQAIQKLPTLSAAQKRGVLAALAQVKPITA